VAAVLAALVPVFLLIVMGYGLRRYLLKDDAHWIGLERLVYFVLFPALLIETTARANLANVPVGGVSGALLLAVLTMAAFCLALRPVLQSAAGINGQAFTSVFQGATRWQTFIGLAVANNLYGDAGVALASVAMVAMIPVLNAMNVAVLASFARPQRLAWPQLLLAIAQNPLIWACVVGFALNVSQVAIPQVVHDFADALGRSSLAIGLLVVGAGLRVGQLIRPGVAASVAVFLKLIAMPAIAISYALLFGLSGVNLAVVAVSASVPAASNSYILAKQLGGDAPLIAQILTLQTILAALTMPVIISLVR
jgi:malonate transporter and related proteins